MSHRTTVPTTPIVYPSINPEFQPETEEIECPVCFDTRYIRSEYIGKPLGNTHDTQRTATTHIVLWLCPGCMTDGDQDRLVLLPDHANHRNYTNEELLGLAV